jgi:polyhydroxybutyrate depolymerase
MTFKLATEIPERFAAVAPVAGQLAIENPKPRKPLPTLFVIGTGDPLVPLEGGETTLPWGKRTTAPVKVWMETWAKAIGAPTEPKRIESKPGLRIEEYSPGRDETFLRVVYIEGHGHGWPGGDEAGLPENLIGRKTTTFDATVELWNFFKQFSRR